jgi:hypothetical protein
MASLTKEDMFSKEYWRAICPNLHVDDAAFKKSVLGKGGKGKVGGPCCSAESCAEVRARLLAEGFASLDPNQIAWRVPAAALAEGILQLKEHGWPASMIGIYDEAWAMGLDAAFMMEVRTAPHTTPDSSRHHATRHAPHTPRHTPLTTHHTPLHAPTGSRLLAFMMGHTMGAGGDGQPAEHGPGGLQRLRSRAHRRLLTAPRPPGTCPLIV